MSTLIADNDGQVRGKFSIPANVPAGAKPVTFRGRGGTRGDAVFVGQGTLNVTTLQSVTTVNFFYVNYDPIAQTFTLAESAQLAGIDLWFTAKSTQVRVQLRETVNGYPGRTVLAETILEPGDIVVSGSHTRVLFDAPVSLSAGVEYAFAVLCDDAVTELAMAEMGKFDARAQQWVSSQPYTVGVMFTSSNASAWTAHQDRDLAFRLLRAVYTESTRDVDMGSVALSGATDVVLMALAESPAADARIDYTLALPDTSSVTVAAEQPVHFSAPVTGNFGVKARLSGTSNASPILYPGTQVLAGEVLTTADYVGRSISAAGATRAVLIMDVLAPSGSSVVPKIKKDSADWEAMQLEGQSPTDDGYYEVRYAVPLENISTAKLKIELSGTVVARPMVRGLRFMALR